MTITFFFNVTDTGRIPTNLHQHALLTPVYILGSWLEIGQSITFFCIASLLLVWSAGICVAGEYLMADSLSQRNLKED